MISRVFVSSLAVALAASPFQPAASAIIDKVAGAAFGTLDGNRAAELKLFDRGGGFHGAFEPFGNLSGGVWVAAGDINGDGRADIIAGHAAGPLVNVFDGVTLAKQLSFEPFGPGVQGGVFVGAGDIDGDGVAEIITGAGPGGGPHVKTFDNQLTVKHDFDAFSPGFQGGVRVSAGDITGDGVAEVIVGTGPGGGTIHAYDGATGQAVGSFDPFGTDFKGGLFFTAGRFQGNAALFVSKATEGDGSVLVFNLADPGHNFSFRPFGTDYRGGVTLGFITDGTSNTLIVGEAEGGRAGFIDVSAGGATIADGFAFDGNPPTGDIFFSPFGLDYLGGISVAGLGLADVPEPATWALMLAGFSATGIALRRRLRRDVSTANAPA